MKRRIAVALFLVALGVTGFGLARKKPTPSVPTESAAPQVKLDVPLVPEDLAASKERLHRISELMKKNFIPRLKKMPAEMKRAQRMVEMNDKIIQQLTKLEESRQIRTPFDEPLTGSARE